MIVQSARNQDDAWAGTCSAAPVLSLAARPCAENEPVLAIPPCQYVPKRPPAVAQCREQPGATEQEYLNMQLEFVDLPFAGSEHQKIPRVPAWFKI